MAMTLACRAGDPGPIPGWGVLFIDDKIEFLKRGESWCISHDFMSNTWI